MTDLGLAPSRPALGRSAFAPNPVRSIVSVEPAATQDEAAGAGNGGHEGPSTSAVIPTNASAEPEEEQVDRVKHPSGIIPVLQNVVATVTLGVQLDLKQIALKARNAEFNPKVRDHLACPWRSLLWPS